MKRLIFAAVLLGQVLFAAHAAAWEDNGTPISSSATVQLTGSWTFAGSYECPNLVIGLELNPAGTGSVTSFGFEDTSKCKVITAYAALGCKQLTAHTATNLPWAIVNNGTNVSITQFDLDETVTGMGLCASGIPLTIGAYKSSPLTLTPDNLNSISSFQISGSLQTSTGTVRPISGTLSVLPSDIGTYGL